VMLEWASNSKVAEKVTNFPSGMGEINTI